MDDLKQRLRTWEGDSETLDKLRATDEAALLRIPNLGRKGLNDIRAALSATTKE